MKNSKIIIIILCILSAIFIIIDISLIIKLVGLKKVNIEDNEKKVEEKIYICELEAGSDVFKYNYRQEIYYAEDGTLIKHKSGSARVVETDEEIEILKKESEMFGKNYDMLGVREIFIYDYINENDDSEIWYEDVLQNLKKEGYTCRNN